MPRLKNRPPAYRLHKAFGQAIVSYQGTCHYLGVHGSAPSHRAYDRFVEQWRLDRLHEQEQEQTEAKKRQRQQLTKRNYKP